jgi:hypothetical protein
MMITYSLWLFKAQLSISLQPQVILEAWRVQGILPHAIEEFEQREWALACRERTMMGIGPGSFLGMITGRGSHMNKEYKYLVLYSFTETLRGAMVSSRTTTGFICVRTGNSRDLTTITAQ